MAASGPDFQHTALPSWRLYGFISVWPGGLTSVTHRLTCRRLNGPYTGTEQEVARHRLALGKDIVIRAARPGIGSRDWHIQEALLRMICLF